MSRSETAFDRRLKRRVSGKRHLFFAACPPGLTSLCKRELEGLANRLDALTLLPPGQSFQNIQLLTGGVSFEARLDMACLANLFLGSPTRILMRVTRFRADNFKSFEKGITGVDWDLFLPENSLPCISASARKSRLYHTQALEERCRNLLSRHLGTERLAASPDPRIPEIKDSSAQTLMIRGEKDWFDLSLDMSGLPLYKRGLKQAVVRAPLRETQAFAILSQLDFGPSDLLVDPMTGSGTFSLEGAMIQAQIPPGYFRTFAFEAWPGFQAKRFAHAKRRIPMTIPESRTIFASDLDRKAVDALARTAASQSFLCRIRVDCMNFFDTMPPRDRNGVVVLNPPYGRRLGKAGEMKTFYAEIGKKLSRDYKGWRAGVICPSQGLFKALGLSLTPMPLFHGGLDILAGTGTLP